ncbi:SMC5-SMC6 complex localization factor protein 1 [Microtus ochrogaster]|uniref:SMC5-SMC6 complex localization factor protein 1 n=1 Tax=Microtus ochrogaster TaxID=79684 RepID=A0A8J6KQC2_MICOH|nr:SMC5-SMC6 complex localization factor protein 1 [Microtus ochrogaster]
MEDGTTKHVIQMTGFKMEEKEALVKLLLKLDCTFIKSEKYKNCTHLIAERLCKSEKFLAACAAGKWVLTKDYIIQSAKSGRWLDETTYEWGYKIEKDSHYSPQMQSAPKRWREELKRTGAPGAFHRWKVVLLVRADKRSESLKEIQNDEHSQTSSGWTKYSNQEKGNDFKKDTGFLEMKAYGESIYRTQKEMKNSLHNDYANESKIKDVKADMDLTEVKNALKKQIYRDIYRAQAVRYNCIRTDKQPVYSVEGKNAELPRGILNLIESLIEGQFFKEAIEELSSLQAQYVPPVCLLHALLENVLQVFNHELAYLLTGILGAAIDYWIFLGIHTGRNVIRHLSADLGSYISLSCDGPELLQQRNSKGELPLDHVLSPKDREELFAITNLDDTVDNFHAQTQKRFYHQQLEFGSFLLSRMLLSFCSIFDLSSEFTLAFKGLAHLSELLMVCNSDTEATSGHTDWLLDLYARNIKALKKLPDVLKELPGSLSVRPGVHTEALLVTLEMMCRSVTEVS